MITLPANAKYFSFIDTTYRYNPNYDITWSFTYSITGNQATQYGISTFLTAHSSVSATPDIGHYLSTDTNDVSNEIEILVDGSSETIYPYNIITVAIDSTGFFALSDASLGRDGVGISSAIPNSLIIRSYDDSVIYNQPLSGALSAINTSIIFRCRFSNTAGNIYIDYRNADTSAFIPLTTVPLNFRIVANYDTNLLYPGISFGSPLMTASTDTNSMILQSFMSDGVFDDVHVENISYGRLT